MAKAKCKSRDPPPSSDNIQVFSQAVVSGIRYSSRDEVSTTRVSGWAQDPTTLPTLVLSHPLTRMVLTYRRE